MALRDRAVEGIDAQLIERLIVGEPSPPPLDREKVAQCQAPIIAPNAGGPRRVGVTGERPALPCAPAARRGRDRQRAKVAIEVEDGRANARRDRRGKDQRVGLADCPFALGEPQLGTRRRGSACFTTTPLAPQSAARTTFETPPSSWRAATRPWRGNSPLRQVYADRVCGEEFPVGFARLRADGDRRGRYGGRKLALYERISVF